MASYTDNAEALGKFNPYVQELPVEAMVEVGMKKQQMYNEGIQRIQANIDNIAGLDVIRGVDRKYLQSKINEMGNNIRTVAAGDFSDFQLVNSTTGMVNQVAKDRTVQNSVSASAMYRKEMARIEKDREAGKENPNNTNYFNKKASNWLNGQTAGESLNEKYFTPIDVWGKITAIAKEVGVDSITGEELFVTDEKGQRIKGPDGNPVLNKIAIQTKLKGKDPAKLLDAFEKGLTAADYKQLAIDGIGNNAHLTPEMLKASIVTTSQAQINDNNQKISNLDLDIISERSKPKRDQARLDSLSNQKSYFEKQNENIAKSRDNGLAKADSDPDAIRASLHTNNYLHSMAKDLSSVDKEEHFAENPLYKQILEDNKFAHQLQQDAFQNKMTAANYNLAVEKELKGDARWRMEFEAKYGALPGQGGGAVNIPIPVPEGGYDFNTATEEKYTATIEAKNNTELEIALAYIDQTAKNNPGKTPEERREYNLRVLNENSGPGKGITRDEYIRKTAVYMQNRWNTGKESVPKEMAVQHHQYNELNKNIQYQKAKIEEVDKLARQRMKTEGLTMPTDAELKAKIKGKSVTVGGVRVDLTPEDMVQFVHSRPDVYNFFGKLSVDKDQERKKAAADLYLTKKFGTKLESLQAAFYPVTKGDFMGSETTGTAMGIADVKSLVYNKNLNKFNQIKNDIYKNKSNIPMGQAVAVNRGKENMGDVNRRVKTAVNTFIDSNGKILGTDHTAAEVYAAMEDEKGNLQFNIKPQIAGGDSTDIDLIVSNKDGTSYTVPVDAQVYRSVMGKNPPMKAPSTQINEMLAWTGSTNKTGSPSTAHWKDNDFTNFKHDGITLNADLKAVKGDPSIAVLKLHIFDKKSGKFIETRDYPNYIPIKDDYGNDVNVENIASQINSTMLTQILK